MTLQMPLRARTEVRHLVAECGVGRAWFLHISSPLWLPETVVVLKTDRSD
jgi:hypothetical protein